MASPGTCVRAPLNLLMVVDMWKDSTVMVVVIVF